MYVFLNSPGVQTTKSNKKIIGGLISEDEGQRRRDMLDQFKFLDRETKEHLNDPDQSYEPDMDKIGRQYDVYKR